MVVQGGGGGISNPSDVQGGRGVFPIPLMCKEGAGGIATHRVVKDGRGSNSNPLVGKGDVVPTITFLYPSHSDFWYSDFVYKNTFTN